MPIFLKYKLKKFRIGTKVSWRALSWFLLGERHPGAEIQQDATDLHPPICKLVSRDVGSTHWPTRKGRQRSLLSRYHQEYHASNTCGRPSKNRALWQDESRKVLITTSVVLLSSWQWTRASRLLKTGGDHAQHNLSCATEVQTLPLHESYNTRLAPKHLVNHKFWVHTKWISTLSLQKHINSGCFCEAYVKHSHADKHLNQKLVLPKLLRQEG